MSKRNIAVIGCGRWGTFITWYLNKIGHSVSLYGRESSAHMKSLVETRSNGLVTLDESVKLYMDFASIKAADTVVISVNSQELRGAMQNLMAQSPSMKTVVICMKGIEISTGKRLSQVVGEYIGDDVKTAVWIGPGHVQEFLAGVPNCMVIDSEDESTKISLVEDFSSELIRFYFGNDMLGNEIGAAAKNVIGIAAGILDGLGLTCLKGALMSRGTREIARLIKKMGGNELSAYGLCHLGDYQATVFSEFSHNRRYGEMLVTGGNFDLLAEGYYTAKALKMISDKYEAELPICNAVYQVLYENASPKEAIERLFLRSIKKEFCD